MKAVVKNGIAVFSPQGFLDGNSQNAFMSTEDIEAATNLKADMILVSQKKLFFLTVTG